MVEISYGLEVEEQQPLEAPEVPVMSFDEILQLKKIVVVDAWADWCIPCRECSPLFEELAHKYLSPDIIFLKDNIDEEESIHRDKIQVVPTFFIYANGVEHSVIQGGEFDTIRAKLDSLTSSFEIA
jgi:thioredoxin 1